MTTTTGFRVRLPGPTYMVSRKRPVRVPRGAVQRKLIRYGTFLGGAQLARYLDLPRRDQAVLAAGFLSGLTLRTFGSDPSPQPVVVPERPSPPAFRLDGALPLFLLMGGVVLAQAAGEFAVFAVAEELYERVTRRHLHQADA
jgi:hypothetical protein